VHSCFALEVKIRSTLPVTQSCCVVKTASQSAATTIALQIGDDGHIVSFPFACLHKLFGGASNGENTVKERFNVCLWKDIA
jgi:hypothetical protein